MPFYPKYPVKKKYSTKKKKQQYGPVLGRRPTLTRQLRVKQNLTRDYKMFKYVERITSNNFGNFLNVFVPTEVTNVADFQNWARCWEEYKVLWFSLKLQPVGIGSESLSQPASGEAMFKRGLALTWVDQGAPDPSFTTVDTIIVRPSCRTVQPRYVHRRKCYRPPGNPDWGQFDNQGAVAIEDQWQDTRIRLWGQDFTPIVIPGSQTYYWATLEYAVLFRGRSQFTQPTGSIFAANYANPSGDAAVLC